MKMLHQFHYGQYWYATHPWLFARDAYRTLRSLVRRGMYGWDISDAWGIDWYLCEFMPDILKHLANHLHGVPADFASEDGMEIRIDEWKLTILKMAHAFKITRIFNRYTPMPNTKRYQLLEQKRQEGFALFVKYFDHLWD